MWIFLASNDCLSSNNKLDSAVVLASSSSSSSSSELEHAAEATQLGFHHKQEPAAPEQLGFHDKKQYAKQPQLGFHDKFQYPPPAQLGFQKKHEHPGPAHLGFQEKHEHPGPAELGFHHELQYAGPAQLGFHDKLQYAELGQSGFHMSLRRLANSEGVATTSAPTQVSPSIVIIIIVLTVIFFLSAFLHLLIRWLARNPALIRRGVRAGADTGTNNRIIALTALQGQLQQLFSIQDAGLERSLIEELPVFSYKAAMGGLKEGADCAICLCEFVGDDQLRLLPSCGHVFHTDCIDTWLLSHSTCPLCRTLLLPECWIPSTLHPLLSSDISAASEAEHQHALDPVVSSLSGRFTGRISSSSRRSSLGRITIIAGSVGPPPIDYSQSQLPMELQLLNLNPNCTPNHADSSISRDSDVANPASLLATNSPRGMANSARLSGSDQNFTNVGKVLAPSESEDYINYSMGINNEGAGSANAKSLNSSSITVSMMDSGRLSYTSLGNHTDAQSETHSELERASAHGSGRRVSVHFGKCRIVHEQGRTTHKSKASRWASSRRSYSKGSYEFVIDSSSNVELLIPPANPRNSHSIPPALVPGSRLNDLLSSSHQASLSSAEIMPNSTNGFQDLVSKNVSPSWATASFRKLKLCSRGDGDASMSTEAMNVPLNTSLPSDKPVNIDRWAEVVTSPELAESSAATSMRAHVGSDASLNFSPEMVDTRLGQLMVGNNLMLAGSNKSAFAQKSSNRAVSFRLPTPASHHGMSARLKASASRRALSESEAFSYWEPSITEEYYMQLDHAGDDQRCILNDDTGIHSRSSSFAKRTMDWLVGWQRRMVHPDKCVANPGCNLHA